MGVATSLTAARMLALEAQTVVGAQRDGDNIFLRRFNSSLINLGSFKGEAGMSAYQIAVANGYVGSVMDWVDSLQGADGNPGSPGSPGDSAYEIAVANGFVGTESDWLTSLVGEPGTPAANDFILAYQTDTPDMNNYKTGGAFAFKNTATNGPIVAPYGVLTVRQTPDDVVQQFQLSSSPYTTWTRRYNNALATWTPWRCLDPVLTAAELGLGGPDSPTLTASNYTSIKLAATNSSSNFVATYNGDCLILPQTGRVTLIFQGLFTAVDTGNRFIGMSLNPGASALNSSGYPSTGRLSYTKFAPTSDMAGSMTIWEGNVNAGDNLMFIARSTASGVKVCGALYETRAIIRYA